MMRGLMPWTGMGNLQREMERMFGRLAEMKWEDLPALGDWSPSRLACLFAWFARVRAG